MLSPTHKISDRLSASRSRLSQDSGCAAFSGTARSFVCSYAPMRLCAYAPMRLCASACPLPRLTSSPCALMRPCASARPCPSSPLHPFPVLLRPCAYPPARLKLTSRSTACSATASIAALGALKLLATMAKASRSPASVVT